MKIIGLTGGIASGKSTVSKYLQNKGIPVIDADAVARELSAPGEKLWQAYAKHFGDTVLQADGSLSRDKIGELVFRNRQELEWINSTAHPLIQERVEHLIAQYRIAQIPLIVLDVPLLFETNWNCLCDYTWLVYVPPEIQLARMAIRDGLNAEQAKARIAAQMSLADKLALADEAIDNSGELAATYSQVDNLLKKLSPDK